MPDKKTHFIEEYTAMIARLDLEQQSLLWWATDLSSKNRYTSSVPDQLEELVHNTSGPSRGHADLLTQRAKKIGAVLWFVGLMFIRSIWSKTILGKRIQTALGKEEHVYVIKTFGYDASFGSNGKYHDAFFGRLPELLDTKAKVLIFVNVLGNFRAFLQKAKRKGAPLIVPVEHFLTWKDIYVAVKDVLGYRIRLTSPVVFDGKDVTTIIEEELYRTFNGVQVQQYLHYHCTKRLLERCRVGTFAMTYENNPWERMCTLALRQYSPQTQIIGYQHAVVPEAALNMFLSPLEKGNVPLPDRILTVGEITTALLKKYGNYQNPQLEPACALRYEYLYNIQRISKPWQGHVLVVLDGVKQTSQLLDYCLQQLKGQKDLTVRIRAHAALPWKYFGTAYDQILQDLGNVSVSASSLQEDLRFADVVIYWQSTVALEAISLGKPVINFVSKDILSYDPMLGCDDLKWKAGFGEPLIAIIEEIRSLDPLRSEEKYQRSKQFIHKHFYPVTKENIRLFGQ